jgi:hypothetical protein
MLNKTTGIRVILLSRACKSGYRPWKIQTTAIGDKYGWMGALQALVYWGCPDRCVQGRAKVEWQSSNLFGTIMYG